MRPTLLAVAAVCVLCVLPAVLAVKEHYGFIEVDNSRAPLFYWVAEPNQVSESTKRITLWLSGGCVCRRGT